MENRYVLFNVVTEEKKQNRYLRLKQTNICVTKYSAVAKLRCDRCQIALEKSTDRTEN